MNAESRPEGRPESPAKKTNHSLDAAADNAADTAPTFQLLPALSEAEYTALRDDVAERGIVVPVVIDQHGRLLDGHHRRAVAAELGIDCPTVVVTVADDTAAADLAVSLNAARRHLTREQRRELIAAELDRRPGDSDRAVARRVGCSPSTVSTVRRVSKLDTTPMSRAEAEALTLATREVMLEASTTLMFSCIAAMSNALDIEEIITAITEQSDTFADGLHPDTVGPVREAMYGPVLDWLADPATAEQYRPEWDHPTFLPLSDIERRSVLGALAGRAA